MERVVEHGRLIGLTADMVKTATETEIKAEKVEVVETPTEKPETKKTTKKSK